MTNISIKNLSFSYPHQKILDQLNMEIHQPGFYVILGRNGSGKSTLFNLIYDLLVPSGGEIIIDNLSSRDKDYPNKIKNKVFYALQNNGLIEDLSVKDNIALIKEFDDTNFDYYYQKFDIAQIEHKLIKHCSMGERQRTLCFISLIASQEILMLDEMSAYLSKQYSTFYLDEIKKISMYKIVLFISHYEYEILPYAEVVYRYANYAFYQEQNHLINKDSSHVFHHKVNHLHNFYKIKYHQTYHYFYDILKYVLFILLIFCTLFTFSNQDNLAVSLLNKENLILLKNDEKNDDNLNTYELKQNSVNISGIFDEPVFITVNSQADLQENVSYSLLCEQISFASYVYIDNQIHYLDDNEVILSDLLYDYCQEVTKIGEIKNLLNFNFYGVKTFSFDKISSYTTNYQEYYSFSFPNRHTLPQIKQIKDTTWNYFHLILPKSYEQYMKLSDEDLITHYQFNGMTTPNSYSNLSFTVDNRNIVHGSFRNDLAIHPSLAANEFYYFDNGHYLDADSTNENHYIIGNTYTFGFMINGEEVSYDLVYKGYDEEAPSTYLGCYYLNADLFVDLIKKDNPDIVNLGNLNFYLENPSKITIKNLSIVGDKEYAYLDEYLSKINIFSLTQYSGYILIILALLIILINFLNAKLNKWENNLHTLLCRGFTKKEIYHKLHCDFLLSCALTSLVIVICGLVGFFGFFSLFSLFISSYHFYLILLIILGTPILYYLLEIIPYLKKIR